VDSTDLQIDLGGVRLAATLTQPVTRTGLIVLVHGGAASRRRCRHRRIAELLDRRGFGTLLVDLLMDEEACLDESDATASLDASALAERLIGVVDSIRDGGVATDQPIGLFGTDLGAAAALITAARRPDKVAAVVCRSGRPDLAGPWLSRLRTPTLLIVGSRDTSILRINREAARRMVAPHELAVIPGATHLLEEPGALDEVAANAAAWFSTRLRTPVTEPWLGLH
jgi:pimeloyl-ACP methyl ester carboxylesterase